jgi:hypothetical protein
MPSLMIAFSSLDGYASAEVSPASGGSKGVSTSPGSGYLGKRLGNLGDSHGAIHAFRAAWPATRPTMEKLWARASSTSGVPRTGRRRPRW